MFQTPVLVIAYHRVESTHDLFTVLREVQPEKLYVAADGALSNDRTDYQHCLEARCVFIPEWKCEMKTLFKETHQGKSKMFVQAMQWFFEQEEEGIVLFDDTVPTADFFHFCKQMLEMYRTDRRIGHISGSYLLKHNRLDESSYYFSAYPLMWGFATWRDRFENFELKMKELENVEFRTLTDKYQMKKSTPTSGNVVSAFCRGIRWIFGNISTPSIYGTKGHCVSCRMLTWWRTGASARKNVVCASSTVRSAPFCPFVKTQK